MIDQIASANARLNTRRLFRIGLGFLVLALLCLGWLVARTLLSRGTTAAPIQLSALTLPPTAIAAATVTPIRTATAVFTPAQPTATPRPAVPAAPTLRSPADGAVVSGYATFTWHWNGSPLAVNEAFEIRLWKEGQSDHYGATGPVRDNTATFNLDDAYGVQNGGSGHYFWTVAVVQADPYQRTGEEAPPHSITIEVDGGGGGSTATPESPTPTHMPTSTSLAVQPSATATPTSTSLAVQPSATATPTSTSLAAQPSATATRTSTSPAAQPSATATVTPVLGPFETVKLPGDADTPVPVPSPFVNTEWPRRMTKAQSATVRVSLIQVAEKGFTPIVEIPGNTAIIGTVVSVTGTPAVALTQRLGPEYQAFARAKLAATTFTIDHGSSEEQSLDQPRVDWIWNISTDKVGPQDVDVIIEVVWRSTKDPTRTVTRQLWRAHLDIDVSTPLIPSTALGFAGLFFGVFGVVLTGPQVLKTAKQRGFPLRPHSTILFDELQRQYDDLTEQIAALDRDLATSIDSEQRLVLQRRRDERVAERERIVAQMRELERKTIVS